MARLSQNSHLAVLLELAATGPSGFGASPLWSCGGVGNGNWTDQLDHMKDWFEAVRYCILCNGIF